MIEVQLTYRTIFILGVQMLIPYFNILDTIQNYHNIMPIFPCEVPYVPAAHLFHNW